MSEQMNYMQRVGHSKCVRCDFETSDDMTFEQQDAAMMAHLADKHPDWMGITRAKPSPEPEAALPEKASEDSWAIADRLGDKIMDDFMDAEPRQAIDDLLNRFVEVYREVPLRGSMIEPGVRLWRDYYKLTGDHMILTDEGWEPGEAKQSYVDQLEPGELVSSVILDEVNAPHQPKRRKERALSGEFSAGVVEPSPEPGAAPASEAPPLQPPGPPSAPRICKKCGGTLYDPVFGGSCKCPHPQAASDAQAPEVPRYRINSDGALEQSGTGTLVTLPDHLAELAQLRARVAILDAQEVELPELKPYRGWLSDATRERERQLLDALRAVQAWREVARNYRGEHREWGCVTSGNQLCGACAAYDALAGKGE